MQFAKHETFHVREGWLFKGMAAVKAAEAQDQLATIFLDKDGPERLGIGRNMVRALRYWIQATGLAEEIREQGRTIHRLSDFGEWVWENDRYLDDEATLWLIHYHLISGLDLVTTWYWFFNHYTPVTFELEVCLQSLKLWVLGEQPDRKIAESSLRKDVQCLVRTYLANDKNKTPEELIESPLARLGLISEFETDRKNRYRFQRLNSARVNPLIVLYVMVDQQLKSRAKSFQVTLNQVLREPMNVGRVFNLDTGSMADLLATLNKKYPDLSVKFERTAGLDQLTLPNIRPEELLERYVQEHIITFRQAA
ncbi:MAG: DUF4007 family protein [Anaerolineae bacterium]|nr:DUF4007 family protein [Anaerolineae bacterium]